MVEDQQQRERDGSHGQARKHELRTTREEVAWQLQAAAAAHPHPTWRHPVRKAGLSAEGVCAARYAVSSCAEKKLDQTAIRSRMHSCKRDRQWRRQQEHGVLRAAGCCSRLCSLQISIGQAKSGCSDS